MLKQFIFKKRLNLIKLTYKSFEVKVTFLISGTEVTPCALNCPSPIERETSKIPNTRPSLKLFKQLKKIY